MNTGQHMNRTKVLDRFYRLLMPATLCLLAGCLPIPHTSLRSADVWGRVLDARTQAPIQGAKVCFSQSPHHTTYTDERGRFRLRATHDFHLAYVGSDGEWPDPKDNGITI